MCQDSYLLSCVLTIKAYGSMCLALEWTWSSFKLVYVIARLLDSFLEWSLAYNSLSNSLKSPPSLFNPLVGFLNYLIILLYSYHSITKVFYLLILCFRIYHETFFGQWSVSRHGIKKDLTRLLSVSVSESFHNEMKSIRHISTRIPLKVSSNWLKSHEVQHSTEPHLSNHLMPCLRPVLGFKAKGITQKCCQVNIHGRGSYIVKQCHGIRQKSSLVQN